MSYDRMTSDDPTLRRDPVYRTQPDSGTRTVAYIVAALIVLGLVYLAATAFWGDNTTVVPASTTTIEQTLPPAAPPATMTPAPDIAPAPDAMAPAPDLSAPAPAAPAPDATLAPEPAPVPPVTEPAQ